MAACDWEAVAVHGAAAARPLAAALAEGDWDQDSDEPYEMDRARATLERIH